MSITFRRLQDRLRDRLFAQIASGTLSGMELARRTGFRQAHISNYLNRKRGLSLEAMDAILRATRSSIADLTPPSMSSPRRSQAAPAKCPNLLAVPVVDGRNLTATQVPNQPNSRTIWITPSVDAGFRSPQDLSRSNWQRFIAVRVKPADVRAMSPRFTSGTVAVVDRHCFSPQLGNSAAPDMYLARSASGFVIRYMEATSAGFVLRPHNADLPLLSLAPARDPLSSIVGRICFLYSQL